MSNAIKSRLAAIPAVAKATKSRLAVIPAVVLTAVGTAHAELPPIVATSMDEAKTDMLAAVGLVIGAMVAVWGLLKLASKLGWR